MHVPLVPFRIPSALVILFSILVLANGCGNASPTTVPVETPPPQVSDANTPLTLWHTFDDSRRDALEKLIQEFHTAYPDLAIAPVYVGSRDDLTKQMTAAIALGTTPDLVLADRRQIALFASQGGLQALDKFLDDSTAGLSKQERADFWRGVLQLGKFPTLSNRTYGFPFDQEAVVLFYNQDWLDQVNLSRAPQTWEEFGEDASVVTKDDQYGWAMRANAPTFEAMLASRGSALLTDLETRALFNERAGIHSLKLVSDLSESGVAQLSASDDHARRAFASGKAAFYFGWMRELAALQRAQKDAKTNFDIGAGVVPQLDSENTWLLSHGDSFGITKTTPERARNAWFFIRWLTSPTNNARWARETGALPLRASALDFLATNTSKSPFAPMFQSFEKSPPNFMPQPAHPFIENIENTVSGLWLQAAQPKPDLRIILDTMADRINQILEIQQP